MSYKKYPGFVLIPGLITQQGGETI